MNCKQVLLIILLLLPAVNILFAQRQNKKPNVIFILADDIGYDVPTVNGGQSFTTPNIDSLARNGLNFTHCEASPLCSPSRFMLLTGKQNYRNYSNWGYMSDTAKHVGQLMRDAGYTTGFFGKLQLQMHSLDNMNRWGWDKFTVFEIQDDSVENKRRYKSPNLVDNKGRVPLTVTNGKYCDDILTSRILDFIDDNKANPFFVYYPMSIGHAPYCPTPDDPEYAGWNPSSGASNPKFFPSMMNYMDKKVGQIVAKLKAAGIADNTIVIYAGDNGTPPEIHYKANNESRVGEKGKALEGGTHVPMVAYWPGTIRPGTNDDLIDFTDFFPTLAALGNYNGLANYAPLDGISFYNRLLGNTGDSVRPNLFASFNPYPGGLDYLNTWVRDKVYKQYDTTHPSYDGTFYNIKTDPEEKKKLDTNHLSQEQKSIRNNFKSMLDTPGLWPKYPSITGAFASDITNNTATLTGTLVNSGASSLVERGSTISAEDIEPPTYRSNHLADAEVKLGTFSQMRSKLQPQTEYFFAMYGMNANASNSTGYAGNDFYTLSNPVLKQATSLQLTDKSCGVTVTWGSASYPKKDGATIGGYILIYSTNKIVLNATANGKTPSSLVTDSKARLVNLKATLPKLPATTTDINTLSKDSLYYFTVVPYTYNGKKSETYNYLTAGAISTTKKPSANGCSTALMVAQSAGISSLEPVAGIVPNPSYSEFTLTLDKSLAGKPVIITVTDAAGREIYRLENKGLVTTSFGGSWKAGVYFVLVKSGLHSYTYKAVKE